MKVNFSNKQWLLIGINIAATLFISIGIGLWLDKRFSTKPKFLLIMLAISIAQVFLLFWRINYNINKRK